MCYRNMPIWGKQTKNILLREISVIQNGILILSAADS